MIVYLKLIATGIIWGGAFHAAKIGLAVSPPVSLAFSRFMLAGLIMTVFVILRGEHQGLKPYLGTLLGLSFVGVLLYNVLFFWGVRLTTPTNGSLIIASNPAITAVMMRVLYGEKLTPGRWLGILLSMTGVFVVVTGGDMNRIADLEFNLGDLLLFGAASCWAVYSIWGKRIMPPLTTFAVAGSTCLLGALMLLPVAVGTEGGSGIISTFQPAVVLAVVYMAVLSSVVAFVWWYDGVKSIGPVRSAVFVNLVPISAMGISAILGDLPTRGQLLGAACVICGVYLTTRRRSTVGDA